MSERAKVLIVDDDRTWQAYLTAGLQDAFEIQIASNGEECLSRLETYKPDSILLDIEMPLMDGYATCKALKQNDALKNIPVLFLSTKSSLNEKVLGFELGADDYIVKPCETEILNAKVDRATRLYRERVAVNQQVEGAQVLAFEAMNSSADLGRTIRFAERTYVMHSFEKLAEGLFQTMSEFGLDTALMFMTADGPEYFAQNGYELTPLEKDMFTAIHNEGRFVDFGPRTFCNFKLVSLLIKNMPLDQPERYGRIKDMVPWILGTADGKVGALDLHIALSNQHDKTSAAVLAISDSLKNLQQDFIETNTKAVVAVEVLYRQLCDLLGERVDEQAEQNYHQILNQMAQYNAMADGLVDLLEKLQALSEAQQQVHEMVEKESCASAAIELGQNEIFSSDVDFF